MFFSLTTEQGPCNFFIKRFFHPHLKDMLFTFRNTGQICSQARYEWINIHTLQNHKIATCHPVCFGQIMRGPLERFSFLVTREIQGQCMADYIKQNWAAMSASDRQSLISSLGLLVRRIHQAGIHLPDLYVWHVFVTESEPHHTLALIDLHRATNRGKSRSLKIRSLGALEYSMLETYFDAETKAHFWDAYFNGQSSADRKAFLRKVRCRARVLRRRRKPPSYD